MPKKVPRSKALSFNLSGPDLRLRVCGAVSTDNPALLKKLDDSSDCYVLARKDASDILAWFSSAADSSTLHAAHLAFSPSIDKEGRAFVHDIVAATWSSALETASSGVGDERSISVYLKGQAPKSSLSPPSKDAMQKAVQLWKAARDAGIGPFSRDEILEQLANGSLCAPLQQLSDAQAQVQEGVKLLVAAAAAGSVRDINDLIAAHPGIASACFPDLETGDLPLHAAARLGMLDALQALVAAGANIEASDERGRTALQVSRSFDQCNAEAVLLQLGATDPDASSFPLVGASASLALKRA